MKLFNEKTNVLGVVTRQAFSGRKLYELLCNELSTQSLPQAIDSDGRIDFDRLCEIGISLVGKDRFALLKNKSIKKQFNGNFLWKFIKKHFSIDLQIPFITGFNTIMPVKGNLIVTTGHKAIADQLGGTTTTPYTAIAYGTGTTPAAAGDTALEAEIARGAATVTNETTTTTGDTEQWVKTFTAAGTQAVTEEGILNNNVSDGILLARQVFAAVNMETDDVIQFTHRIQT